MFTETGSDGKIKLMRTSVYDVSTDTKVVARLLPPIYTSECLNYVDRLTEIIQTLTAD